MLSSVNCKHNPKGVICEYNRKRCILYPIIGKFRGISETPIYKDKYCQLQEPWPEGQSRNDWKRKKK